MNDSRKHIPPIILALVISLLPHVMRLPGWVIVWCAFMWTYMLVSLKYNLHLPGRFAKNLLAVLGIAGLLVTYHTKIDSSAYISLLAIMAAIKPFEVSTHRDRMITVFMAYFIVITSLLQSETLLMTIYMFVSVVITTAVLVRINDPESRFKANFRVSFVMLAQAAPLMLILFFLFPRMEGSLVGITPSETGITGFSQTLRPGSVSRLATDNSVAFRVEFDDEIPDFQHLYWRGVVFSHFDGTTWHRERGVPEKTKKEKNGDTAGYTVTLEPHNDRWLFALDFPESIPDIGTLYEDFTVISDKPVYRSKQYYMQSNITDRISVTGFQEKDHIRLPERGNSKSRKLAAGFAEQGADTQEVVEAVLAYFEAHDFIYTRNPPLAGKDPVDEFLFDFQKGYCEHYASAFVFLMRSAGIPARVVGGYLGGEVNPYGNYLIVRQSHAHAWAEIWDEKKGWFRVDPTLIVAPGRIAGGPEGVLSADELAGFVRKYLHPFSSFINQAKFGWDAFSKNWEAWFARYSYDQQQSLLERLGIETTYRTGLIKLLSTGLVMVFFLLGLYAFFHLRAKKTKPDSIKKTYEKFLKKLAMAGTVKKPEDGPLEFAARVARERNDLTDAVDEITRLYVRLRYSPNADEDVYFRFKAKVNDFAPGPTNRK